MKTVCIHFLYTWQVLQMWLLQTYPVCVWGCFFRNQGSAPWFPSSLSHRPKSGVRKAVSSEGGSFPGSRRRVAVGKDPYLPSGHGFSLTRELCSDACCIQFLLLLGCVLLWVGRRTCLSGLRQYLPEHDQTKEWWLWCSVEEGNYSGMRYTQRWAEGSVGSAAMSSCDLCPQGHLYDLAQAHCQF